MSTQEQVNADTAAVGQVATDLEASKASIQAELDKLQAQINAGAAVDLGALTNAVNQLDAPVKAIGALQPTPAAPPSEEPAAETPAPPAEETAVETPAPPAESPAPPADGSGEGAPS